VAQDPTQVDAKHYKVTFESAGHTRRVKSPSLSRGENAMSAETTNPTLYERLGGVYSIAAVVDDFIDRVMHNPVLNANPAVDEAHHGVSAAGFKYYVTEMVCWATGGPQNILVAR
jgi:tetrahydromethanopterin S-methyltransferase subunit H